jgi:hypothetical protein
MSNIHPSWVKAGGVALEIMEGKHDAHLNTIADACNKRLKAMFRKGQQVRLTGTRNVELEGQVGVVLKVNPKRITVGLGERGQFGYESEYNVPPHMLEVV